MFMREEDTSELWLCLNQNFKSDLFSELVETVLKTGLNDSLMNQTDPVLMSTHWLNDPVTTGNKILTEISVC